MVNAGSVRGTSDCLAKNGKFQFVVSRYKGFDILDPDMFEDDDFSGGQRML